MKYSIVIPTYHAHYDQIDILLNSFSINCLDKKIISIRLIISKDDVNLFKQLVNKYHDLDLDIHALSDIIKEIDNININENQLLSQTGKYNFQSIKKLYGAKYVNTDMVLVTDSESILIKKCYFEDVFKNFEKNKFIIHSKIHRKHNNPIQARITKSNFGIFNEMFEDKWFLDSQYWFYEKNIINDFFNYIDSHNKSVMDLHIGSTETFDFALYSTYIYLNNDKYDYNFLDMTKILSEKMGHHQYNNYIQNTQAETSFEYFIWDLNKNNFQIFKDIYKEYNLSFFKFDDRFQNNQLLQQKFISDTGVVMLSCRVVCNSFKQNGFEIPVNHRNNQPVLK